MSISPLAQSSLDEALGLAAGAWGVGTGKVVAQLELATGGGKGAGAVAVAVVGEQASHPDAELSVIVQGGVQEGDGGGGGLVGQDVGEGEARVVVDGDVHVCPAGARADAATTAIGTKGDGAEAAQHLDIQVEQIAGRGVFVADAGRSRFEIAQAMDADGVDWLKSYGPGYQTKANLLLRHAMSSTQTAKVDGKRRRA